ncbi:uncharacterized protein METZ01_LOCUS468896 [marine metagenome]|uniref:Uncharacterized protein n=1 Tax=marine metagenome TaxID=408172 RepID=A0A383B7Q9_9ZZZZ
MSEVSDAVIILHCKADYFIFELCPG